MSTDKLTPKDENDSVDFEGLDRQSVCDRRSGVYCRRDRETGFNETIPASLEGMVE